MREKCYLLKKQNNLLQASVDQYKYVKPKWQEYNIIERQDIIMDVERFVELMTGNFDNKEQFEQMKASERNH